MIDQHQGSHHTVQEHQRGARSAENQANLEPSARCETASSMELLATKLNNEAAVEMRERETLFKLGSGAEAALALGMVLLCPSQGHVSFETHFGFAVVTISGARVAAPGRLSAPKGLGPKTRGATWRPFQITSGGSSSRVTVIWSPFGPSDPSLFGKRCFLLLFLSPVFFGRREVRANGRG